MTDDERKRLRERLLIHAVDSPPPTRSARAVLAELDEKEEAHLAGEGPKRRRKPKRPEADPR